MRIEEIKKLAACSFFHGLEEDQIKEVLTCFQAKKKILSQGSYLAYAGDSWPYLGIVLSGNLHLFQEDFWGNRSLLTEISSGDLFGESYACAAEPLAVDILAVEPSEVLLLQAERIIRPCENCCIFHHQLLQRLMLIFAAKNIGLTEKVQLLSQRSTREKILLYLSKEAKKLGTSTFEIPFNRQQLADYLSVDRSALSAKLSEMQKEGVFSFSQNQFKLLSE